MHSSKEAEEGFYHCTIKDCQSKYKSINLLSDHVLGEHCFLEKRAAPIRRDNFVSEITDKKLMALMKRVNPFERNFRKANYKIMKEKIFQNDFNSDANIADDKNLEQVLFSPTNSSISEANFGSSPPPPSVGSCSTMSSIVSSSELPSLSVKLPETPPILANIDTQMDTPDIANLVSQVSRDDSKAVPPTADVLIGVLEMGENRKELRWPSFESVNDMDSRFRDLVPSLSDFGSPTSQLDISGGSGTGAGLDDGHRAQIYDEPAKLIDADADLNGKWAEDKNEAGTSLDGINHNQMFFLQIQMPDNSVRMLPIKVTSGTNNSQSALSSSALMTSRDHPGPSTSVDSSSSFLPLSSAVGANRNSAPPSFPIGCFPDGKLSPDHVMGVGCSSKATNSNKRRAISPIFDQSSASCSASSSNQRTNEKKPLISYAERHVTQISAIDIAPKIDYCTEQSALVDQSIKFGHSDNLAPSSNVDMDDFNKLELLLNNSDHRKQDTLERNKMAASRYRKRKKFELDHLAVKVKQLENEKLELTIQAQVLSAELNRITTALYNHVTSHNCKLKSSSGPNLSDSVVCMNNKNELSVQINDGSSYKVFNVDPPPCTLSKMATVSPRNHKIQFHDVQNMDDSL